MYSPNARKLYSEACERNKRPILSVLRGVFSEARKVLEIGSGTGQHAVYFSRHLAYLSWQPSDLDTYFSSIVAWSEDAALPNLLPPLELNVTERPWPIDTVDGVFSANTVHIMSWPEVEALFHGVADVLAADGQFCLYGPFSRGGRHGSASNLQFDAMLRSRDPVMGIRDLDDLQALGEATGLRLNRSIPMPANNEIMIWVHA